MAAGIPEQRIYSDEKTGASVEREGREGERTRPRRSSANQGSSGPVFVLR